MNDAFDAGKLLDAVAPAVGLTIAEQHRPGVVLHLDAAHSALMRMKGFALEDDAEPAPLFRPEPLP